MEPYKEQLQTIKDNVPKVYGSGYAAGAGSVRTADGTVVSPNADFAEVAEWADGNPNNEDRTGYFVCANVPVDGIVMKKATSLDDVKGVSILAPAFAGNYSKDKLDADGNLLPKYSYVAIIGFVPVIDNGTCTVGGRCMPDDNGCAVPSSNSMGYQVVNRIDENRVLIIIEPNGDMVQRIKSKINQMQADIDTLAPDQNYNPESENAQSGKAVAEALKNATDTIKEQTALSSQISLKGLNVSPIEHELNVICKSNAITDFSNVEVFACSQLTWNEVEEGGLSGNGGIYTDNRLLSTDYIKVEPTKVCRVTWGKTMRWLNLYDTNYQFIKQVTTADLKKSNDIFQIPANAVFMRVTIEKGDTCDIKQGEIYVPNANGIVEGIMSTTPYTTLLSLTDGVYIQVEYNITVNERLETAIATNSEQILEAFNLLNAIQTMDIDVDRPSGGTITVEPETIYMCDSGSNDELISFTQDRDDNAHTGRIVLLVVGKEYAHQNKYTLAYVVTLTKGVLSPTYANWSFYARIKGGYNTKITFPGGSSIVKIKNVKK